MPMDGLQRVWLRVTVRPTAEGVVAELESSERRDKRAQRSRARGAKARFDPNFSWPKDVELDTDLLEELLVELEAVLHDVPVSDLNEPIGSAFRDGGTQPATIPVFLRLPDDFDSVSFRAVDLIDHVS